MSQTNVRPIGGGVPAPPRAKRLTLGAVTRGVVTRPLRVVLSGVEGVGKSTFAAGAPSPIFLGPEEGTGHLDVARFPEATSWLDVFDAVEELQTGEHAFQTLVVDTVDWLEPLCWAQICKKAHKASIEDFGYGKGYLAALEEWRRLTAALDALRAARGMHVVLLAHAAVRRHTPPDGEPYDRYGMKMHEKSAVFLREWSDCVLFARHEVHQFEKRDRMRAIATGHRVLHTQWSAAYDAKNRCGLPETLPLAWEDFYAAVEAGAPAAASDLVAEIQAMLPLLAPEGRDRAARALEARAGDALGLSKVLDWCRARAGQSSDECTP